MPIIEVKSGGNPTYQNENSMKQVPMGNNISLVDLKCSINFNCMRVYPYDVDRACSALTKVESLLLMNTIFLMDGMFNVEHTLWIHLYGSGGGDLPMRIQAGSLELS